MQIPRSPELRRIAALPRRVWSDADAREVAALLTAKLKTAHGTARLYPIQGIMLAEAADARGLLGAVGVGEGKFLPSVLIPTLLDARRPVLMIQASLRAQTEREIAKFSRHFRIHPGLKIVHYEGLSCVSQAACLDAYAPDLIVADECHALKNTKSARGRRFMRYMREHPTALFVGLSGTITQRSILDYWHLAVLASRGRGEETAPLPIVYAEVEQWAQSLDANVHDDARIDPGALLDLSPAAPDDPRKDLACARHRYRKRLADTCGYILTMRPSITTPLSISTREVVVPDSVSAALETLRTQWVTPNGDNLEWAMDVWRCARELAIGCWYRWYPPPREEWRAARRAWHAFVRQTLAQQRKGLDSPLQVALHYATHPLHQAWCAIRDEYDPSDHTVVTWIDDFLLRDAAEWLARHEHGIVWCEHVAAGQRLSEMTGYRYYEGGERAAREIDDARGPVIASIAAHGTGRNLQRYHDNLILSCPPAANEVEQLIGRTHRLGQEDAVSVEIYLHAQVIREAFATVIKAAQYIRETTGSVHRLLIADTNFSLDELATI